MPADPSFLRRTWLRAGGRPRGEGERPWLEGDLQNAPSRAYAFATMLPAFTPLVVLGIADLVVALVWGRRGAFGVGVLVVVLITVGLMVGVFGNSLGTKKKAAISRRLRTDA
jgi:hypothetical protein